VALAGWSCSMKLVTSKVSFYFSVLHVAHFSLRALGNTRRAEAPEMVTIMVHLNHTFREVHLGIDPDIQNIFLRVLTFVSTEIVTAVDTFY
jgi:hypothetical protein